MTYGVLVPRHTPVVFIFPPMVRGLDKPLLLISRSTEGRRLGPKFSDRGRCRRCSTFAVDDGGSSVCGVEFKSNQIYLRQKQMNMSEMVGLEICRQDTKAVKFDHCGVQRNPVGLAIFGGAVCTATGTSTTDHIGYRSATKRSTTTN